MQTTYKGIDYGNSLTNRNAQTGIRYGVISQNEVLQAWADSSEADYGKPQEFTCPECNQEVAINSDDCSPINWGDTVACPNCGAENECELPDCAEPISFTYEKDGYACQCGEDGDIFILKSPFFTYAQFCSPCAPGACYLTSPLEEPDENNKAYCFGHDWFDDDNNRRAPYPVYSVETGELIQPEKE